MKHRAFSLALLLATSAIALAQQSQPRWGDGLGCTSRGCPQANRYRPRLVSSWELSAVAELPPIAALSAHGFLAVNLHVATGGAPQVLSKRKQLGVLACSVTLHRFDSRYAATRRSRPVM